MAPKANWIPQKEEAESEPIQGPVKKLLKKIVQLLVKVFYRKLSASISVIKVRAKSRKTFSFSIEL